MSWRILLLIFKTFKKMQKLKPILSSQATQKQVAVLIWPKAAVC